MSTQQSEKPEEMLTHQEIRCVLKRVMLLSRSETQRWKEAMEAHKDEDPIVLAQFSIRLVEHTSEWNTAFLIANELKISLREEQEAE